VLQGAPMSAYRISFNFRFSIPGDKFCIIDRIQKLRSPVLLIHGTNDEVSQPNCDISDGISKSAQVVPFWHACELYHRVPSEFRYKPFWVRDAGHNNLEMKCMKDGSFFRTLREFILYCA